MRSTSSSLVLKLAHYITDVFSARWGQLSTVQWLGHTLVSLAPTGMVSRQEQSCLNAREAEHRGALSKLELAMNVAEDLEHQLGITERWTSEHPEFQHVLTYLNHHHYIRAVNQLEGLVVVRLFELAKANLMGTCACSKYSMGGWLTGTQVIRCVNKFLKQSQNDQVLCAVR